MRARTFWKTIVADRTDLLEELIGLLESHAVSYCVVGGQGVNAYVDPVVSLDLAIAAREARGSSRFSGSTSWSSRFLTA